LIVIKSSGGFDHNRSALTDQKQFRSKHVKR
jgi:hypothetical protein